MKWPCLFLVLFVALLFVSPCFIYSEEMAVITRGELETLLNEREFLKAELQDYKTKFQDLDGKYLTIKTELHRLKIESELRIASLNDLKKTTTWNNIKSFIAGLGVGFAGGEAVGIKIGIALD